MFRAAAWIVDCRPLAVTRIQRQLKEMRERFFTVVCDFRGGVYISQVHAADERDAVRQWVTYLRRERPIKKVSSYIARSVLDRSADDPPIALKGLSGAWCVTDVCGGDLVLMNIIESIPPSLDVEISPSDT